MNKKDIKTRIDGDVFYLEIPKITFKLAMEKYALVEKNRGYLTKWLNWPYENITGCPEDSFNYLKSTERDWKTGKNYIYLLFFKDTNEIIGSCGTVDVGKNMVELAYWLAPNFGGKGIITKAVELLEQEFSKAGFERFVIKADPQNIPSNKIPQRLGYELEGTEKYSFWTTSFNTYRDLNVWSKIIKKENAR